jgi:PAS domain-containing protein
MRRQEVWKIGTKVLKEPANRFFFHAEEQAAVSSKTLAIISIQSSHRRIYENTAYTEIFGQSSEAV